MKQKELRVYVLGIYKENPQGRFPIRADELRGLLESLRALPVNMSEPGRSRYSDPLTGEEHCMIFSDEVAPPILLDKKIVGGVFIRRRSSTRPFEEDAHGHLIELRLSDETNQIAEVAFFLVHIEQGVLFWIPNPIVGGINRLSSYVNGKFSLCSFIGINKVDLAINHVESSIVFSNVIYPNAYRDFVDKMTEVFSLELDLVGQKEELAQLLLGERPDEKREIELMRHLFNSSNCTKLSIGLRADSRGRPSKKEPKRKHSLNKDFLLDLWVSTRPALESNPNSKFFVRGKMTDEETRILDLLNARLMYGVDLKYDGPCLPLPEVLAKMQAEMFRRIAEIIRYTS
jgi:hypothetical protein